MLHIEYFMSLNSVVINLAEVFIGYGRIVFGFHACMFLWMISMLVD